MIRDEYVGMFCITSVVMSTMLVSVGAAPWLAPVYTVIALCLLLTVKAAMDSFTGSKDLPESKEVTIEYKLSDDADEEDGDPKPEATKP